MSTREQPGQAGDPPTGQPGPSTDGRPHAAILSLDQLSLSFGGLRAISELDLRVDDGEIVSLIGPNGAGKTTVFNVITGVYQPSSGRSPGSRRTGSPAWESPGPSRACGCS